MSAAKIKKGDNVVVRSGKDKGRTGTVLQVMPKEGKIVVQGVNVATRHRKPSQANPQGGIDRREAPMGGHGHSTLGGRGVCYSPSMSPVS